MKRVLLIVLILAIAAPFAQGEAPVDEIRFTLRQELLRLINRDRKQFGQAILKEVYQQLFIFRMSAHYDLELYIRWM